MRALSLFILLLLALTTHAQGQITISGKVTDAENGETVIAARVAERVNNVAANTNTYGYFSLRVPEGQVEVTINYLGYEPWSRTFTATADTSLNIDLSPQAQKIEETTHRNQCCPSRAAESADE